MTTEAPESTPIVAGEEVEKDESFDDVIESQLAPAHAKNVTYIDDLPDAIVVVDGTKMLTTDAHGNVVIERWATIGGTRRWLGTYQYKVVDINQSGDVRLYDEVNSQSAYTNYLTAPAKHGWRFKLPIKGLNLHAREKGQVTSLAKNGVKYQGYAPPSDSSTGHAADTTTKEAGDKKQRAPRRPQEVVDAEKKARMERQKERRLRREARQLGKP